MTGHLSHLILDQLRAGVLDDPGPARAHLDVCPRCRARLDAMASADARFLERFPSEAALVRQRPAPAPVRRSWPAVLVGAAATAAVVLALVLLPVGPQPPGREGTSERTKGSSWMEIAVSRGASSFPYAGQPLREGDILVFRYSSPRAYLLLLTLEASGRVRVLLPVDGRTSMSIQRGAKIRLPQGIELDDYPGPERLIALFSDGPLSAAEVTTEVERRHAALRERARAELALGPLPFPGDSLSWLLSKERR